MWYCRSPAGTATRASAFGKCPRSLVHPRSFEREARPRIGGRFRERQAASRTHGPSVARAWAERGPAGAAHGAMVASAVAGPDGSPTAGPEPAIASIRAWILALVRRREPSVLRAIAAAAS